ncbi:hypothetical protein [Methylosinus sp. Sm6]|uniref:hypothetical protein n=1 Tax=Methylosinus sp. Sm6 TaxID=2866948 RepID=UPI001C98FBCD|nr:hypothetical protein [Methylosinus sp. Sm6]MBY6241244.1 hypothetical protein [Methylosinus sp. Sm6]
MGDSCIAFELRVFPSLSITVAPRIMPIARVSPQALRRDERSDSGDAQMFFGAVGQLRLFAMIISTRGDARAIFGDACAVIGDVRASFAAMTPPDARAPRTTARLATPRRRSGEIVAGALRASSFC